MSKDRILVTGGAGYIGSHTVAVLLDAEYEVLVLDNLSNSSFESLRRVEKICGRSLEFLCGDVRDSNLLNKIFNENDIKAVIHFAGLKSVGESVSNPLKYHQNNVEGSINLLRAMSDAGIRKFVFSSSATVYGDPKTVPIDELALVGDVTNPYGRTKLVVEQILGDVAMSDPRWQIAVLRYFNPVGAHESGLIGEDPQGFPNNLLPFISQVAVGRLEHLSVFGADYPTHDGTGVRDYIHVMDLAEGHLKALEALNRIEGAEVWNLGTGRGYSVIEVIRAFENASGKSVNYEIVGRRGGDIAECWANPTKAERELGWVATRDLDQMMRDCWRWQSAYPDGYGSE